LGVAMKQGVCVVNSLSLFLCANPIADPEISLMVLLYCARSLFDYIDYPLVNLAAAMFRLYFEDGF